MSPGLPLSTHGVIHFSMSSGKAGHGGVFSAQKGTFQWWPVPVCHGSLSGKKSNLVLKVVLEHTSKYKLGISVMTSGCHAVTALVMHE